MRILIVLLLLSFKLHANVAVCQINEIIEKRQSHSLEIKKEFKDYYLLYVFKSTCPYSQKFTPLLEDFSQSTGVVIKAYSIDGPSLGALKSSPIDPQLFDALFTRADIRPVVPALFLINKHTAQAYPVSFGQTNAVDLVSRLDELMKHIKEKFDA